MPIKQGESRSQFRMLCSEELVPQDDITRVIDAFVEALEMDSFDFDDKGKSEVGREAFSNKVMLKIYLFGYTHKIRSSRELKKACEYDVRLWWLTEELKPKYRVIADFRKNNKASFKKVFRSFTRLLQSNNLIGGEIIAVDGTKIKASNSRRKNYSAKKLEKQIEHIDAEIKEYLDHLQAADAQYNGDEEKYKNRLAQVQQKKKEKLGLQNKMEEQNELQISTVDEDARLMQSKQRHMEMAYNVQTSTDEKNNLIVDFEVTNQKDTNALHDACSSVMEILGKEKIKALADKGYHTGLELQKCEASKIETYVCPRALKGKKDSDFSLDKFVYDKKKDCYICPNNKELKSNGQWRARQDKRTNHKAYQVKTYKANRAECKECPFRERCLSPSSVQRNSGKKIERNEYQDYKDANDKRVFENKDLYKKRQQIVEHPFGTIKRSWGMGYTLLRTIPKVEAEIALAYLSYNLVRAKNILGVADLIKRIKKQKITFAFILNRLLKQFRVILSDENKNRISSNYNYKIIKLRYTA